MNSSATAGSTAQKTTPNKLLIIILSIIGVAFVALFGYRLMAAQAPKTSVLSGSINFNGLKPSDDPNVDATIKLMQRAEGETSFSDTGVSIPVADLATWTWLGPISGTTYELRADGYIGSQLIKSTNVITATAPGTDLVLTFNITTADLPESMRPAPTPEKATVSGSIVINGFIPSGSYVTIFGRPSGADAKYTPVIQNIPAKNGTTWKYEQATAGETYDYQAEMYTSAGTFIGESPYITVTAPAANEIVTINSTATAPVQTATISGVVKLQGPVDQNSTILVLQRKVGASEYTAINRYPAVNNTTWKWTGAVSGTTYEITAALQVNEQNTASGNTVTTSAPASNVTVTIDTGVNLPTPTQTVRVSCGQPDGTNHYNAQLSIPQYPDAKTYYLQVGTAAGTNNTFAGTVQPNSTTTVYVAGNSPYFTRFSYSACTDCDLKDTGNWAGWSPTYGFICTANGPTTYSE